MSAIYFGAAGYIVGWTTRFVCLNEINRMDIRSLAFVSCIGALNGFISYGLAILIGLMLKNAPIELLSWMLTPTVTLVVGIWFALTVLEIIAIGAIGLGSVWKR